MLHYTTPEFQWGMYLGMPTAAKGVVTSRIVYSHVQMSRTLS